MNMLTVTLSSNDTANTLLITGAHHARELTSIQLPLYVLLKVVH